MIGATLAWVFMDFVRDCKGFRRELPQEVSGSHKRFQIKTKGKTKDFHHIGSSIIRQTSAFLPEYPIMAQALGTVLGSLSPNSLARQLHRRAVEQWDSSAGLNTVKVVW